MANSRIALIVIGVFLTAQAATPQECLGQPCTGKYKGGLKPASAELVEILKNHAAWLKDGGLSKLVDDPRRANFCGANLKSVHLSHADLSGADLEGADLFSADLNGAYLGHADLNGAYLNDAHLNGADLSGAHLNSAHLEHTELSAALLNGTQLNGANLNGANLNGARLRRAQVSKARLDYVILTEAFYAPASEPPDPYVAGITGLTTIHAASGEEIGLIQLRKLLQDAGLHDTAREATFAIQHNITRDQLSSQFLSPAWIAGILRTVGLEWTTAYGLHPERALGRILLLGVILTPVYMFAMIRPTAESGVMKVFPAGRLDGTAGDPADEEKPKKQLVEAKGWRDALPVAAYFSLISSVNIGFEQFTPGDWIRRLQKRVYSLEAVGWVRVVAGVQALISVYLLAMWVLTQFGQPFE